MVTGTTLNGTRHLRGWASYFLDHSALLPGPPVERARRAAGALLVPSARTCSQVGGFPEDLRAGEDTVVNLELCPAGVPRLPRAGRRLVHHSPCRRRRG